MVNAISLVIYPLTSGRWKQYQDIHSCDLKLNFHVGIVFMLEFLFSLKEVISKYSHKNQDSE